MAKGAKMKLRIILIATLLCAGFGLVSSASASPKPVVYWLGTAKKCNAGYVKETIKFAALGQNLKFNVCVLLSTDSKVTASTITLVDAQPVTTTSLDLGTFSTTTTVSPTTTTTTTTEPAQTTTTTIPLTIDVSISANSEYGVALNGTDTAPDGPVFTATVTNSDGSPAQDALTFTLSGPGTNVTLNGQSTGTVGVQWAEFNVSKPGQYTMTVTAYPQSGAYYFDGVTGVGSYELSVS
jgi:hypothetical protein